MRSWMENVQVKTWHIVGASLLRVITYAYGTYYVPGTVLIILQTTPRYK